MADFRALVLDRHRQLKWKAFDPLEALLMILCGVCIGMFTVAVLCDVVTRTIGVKIVDNVDKTGFVTAAQPVQDQLAQELGPHAVKLLKLVRDVK